MKRETQKKVEANLITKVELRRLEVRVGMIHSSLNVLIGSSGQHLVSVSGLHQSMLINGSVKLRAWLR